jgi:hypothetical protein
MPHRGPDPLIATSTLVVDGSNLLHAIRRGGTPLPPAALIGRLRAVIPAETAIELFLDGAPEPGMRRQRVAAGLTVRYAAPVSADAAILARLERLDPVAADGILVVTDDRDLRHALERRGARTARTHWMLARLARVPLSAPATGNPRPRRGGGTADGPAGAPGGGRGASGGPGAGDEEDANRWRPGRGATAKRGNPKRHPRRSGG